MSGEGSCNEQVVSCSDPLILVGSPWPGRVMKLPAGGSEWRLTPFAPTASLTWAGHLWFSTVRLMWLNPFTNQVAILVDHGFGVDGLTAHPGCLQVVGPSVMLDQGLGIGVRAGSELKGRIDGVMVQFEWEPVRRATPTWGKNYVAGGSGGQTRLAGPSESHRSDYVPTLRLPTLSKNPQAGQTSGLGLP